ncbi:hypothetical protein PR202_gb27899 [Eleusine coracana subsp. coracana]|uniref:DYW domain-containing protein n=1 Tax=Eleusine coracana subsp. coracana TaxID=191504 RepID=A0AAV5FVF0_ELECO|nr:hypothetical protein PR202_gb27899 [Eleusine coracana subsp. coracana]
MLAARGLRRLAVSALRLTRRAASGLATLPGAGAARFHDYDAAVTACVERRALREGRQVHARMVAAGYRPALYLATRLVIMYARCGALEDARNVLDGMPERNVVSWTAMISGYSQNGRPEQALELFITMLRDGSSLLDMYAKSETIQEARRVFDMLPVRDVVSYTAIISGYSHLGLDEEALDLFQKLYNEGMECNQVTFTALLNALSGMASLDYGKQVHGFILRKELPFFIALQNSLIDMYSKCGKLLYSRRVFDNMPERAHANVHVGELVSQKLLEIEPENAGNYVILSNIYAAAGMWKDVFRVRKLMLKKTVIKEPGQSWIILDKVIHTFHSSERFHPRREDIDAKIKEIYIAIKAAGFIPDLSCVLHDVDDEQKERMLLGHSEKLAITFGLMSTPSGFTIQVMKNLRICVDCHNFAKFVSKVYEREGVNSGLSSDTACYESYP